MIKVKTIEKAAENWANNSTRANPDRILGIVRAYLEGRQPIKWAVGLLKSEDSALVKQALDSLRDIDPARHEELSNSL